MGLIINQGKQDTSQDNKFNPIEEKDVIAQITKLKLSDVLKNTLEVTMQLITGANKNRIVIDRVNFDPSSDFSWKYRALRKAAGVPYSEDEDAAIDIEALLLNRAVNIDLGIRKGKDKNGDEKDYQNITYKKPLEKTKDADEYTADTSTPTAEPTEEDEDFISEDEWD